MAARLTTRQVGGVSIVDVAGRVTVGGGSNRLRFSFHVICLLYPQAAHRTRRSMRLPRWRMLWKWRSGWPQAGQVNIGEIIHRGLGGLGAIDCPTNGGRLEIPHQPDRALVCVAPRIDQIDYFRRLPGCGTHHQRGSDKGSSRVRASWCFCDPHGPGLVW
jgi:hypothetical protein